MFPEGKSIDGLIKMKMNVSLVLGNTEVMGDLGDLGDLVISVSPGTKAICESVEQLMS